MSFTHFLSLYNCIVVYDTLFLICLFVLLWFSVVLCVGSCCLSSGVVCLSAIKCVCEREI